MRLWISVVVYNDENLHERSRSSKDPPLLLTRGRNVLCICCCTGRSRSSKPARVSIFRSFLSSSPSSTFPSPLFYSSYLPFFSLHCCRAFSVTFALFNHPVSANQSPSSDIHHYESFNSSKHSQKPLRRSLANCPPPPTSPSFHSV